MSTRTKIGLIGLVLLIAGGYLRWLPPDSLSNPDTFVAACLRVGLVMCALWLAYPELVKLPTWISAATFIATPLIAWRPRAALVILPVLFIAWVLYPRGKKSAKDDS